MLDHFAAVRRKFLNHRLAGWTDEERSALLDLLTRFSKTIADFDRTARDD